MNLLAQISMDTVPSIVTVIVGGSGAVFLINQVLAFYKDHIREQPAPADTYATLKAHEELKEMVSGLATKEQLHDLKEEVDKIDHERRSGIAGLHKKIEDVERRLDQRIDALPARIIQLLKDTKGLI